MKVEIIKNGGKVYKGSDVISLTRWQWKKNGKRSSTCFFRTILQIIFKN